MKLKYLLLKSVLNTDFIFLKTKFFLQNSNSLKYKSLNKKTHSYLLNPIEFIANLKQYIRLIQFFKKAKNSILNFFVKETHQENIINKFFLLNKLNIKHNVFYKFFVVKKEKNSQFLLILKDFLWKSEYLSKKVLNKNIFLIQEVNINKIYNGLNTYKMYNSTLDYKKIIFLLIFVKQIWKSSIQKKLSSK